MSDEGDDRGTLERRLCDARTDLFSRRPPYPGDDRERAALRSLLAEAEDVLGECRRAMDAARRLVAGLTPMGSPDSGIELSAVQEAVADGCDEVRGQITAALAKLGEGG